MRCTCMCLNRHHIQYSTYLWCIAHTSRVSIYTACVSAMLFSRLYYICVMEHITFIFTEQLSTPGKRNGSGFSLVESICLPLTFNSVFQTSEKYQRCPIPTVIQTFWPKINNSPHSSLIMLKNMFPPSLYSNTWFKKKHRKTQQKWTKWFAVGWRNLFPPFQFTCIPPLMRLRPVDLQLPFVEPVAFHYTTPPPQDMYGQSHSAVSDALTVKLGRGLWLNGWWFNDHPTTCTPQQHHCSGMAIATYGLLVITSQKTLNSFSDCSVLQMDGPLINTLLWFCFPLRRNVCLVLRCSKYCMYSRYWQQQQPVWLLSASRWCPW